MRSRARELEAEIQHRLERDEIGKLLTTIQRIGRLTAAPIIAEVGNPARFRNSGALASYVGVTPRLHQSGKRNFSAKGAVPLGNARLRRALWMPVLVAVRVNPWLGAYYLRLRRAGKRPKVAMIACMHKLLTAIYSVAKNRRPFVVRSSRNLPDSVRRPPKSRSPSHRNLITGERGRDAGFCCCVCKRRSKNPSLAGSG